MCSNRNESEHAHLVSSLDSAVDLLQRNRDVLARTFLIGGAQLYPQAMEKTPSNAVLDQMLITRIFEPSFDECDVFLPEFRSKDQIREDEEGSRENVPSQINNWKRCEEGELASFVGEKVDEGVIEEKGVRYQLQMWQRKS
jgi:dihydrofolate reductase